MAWIELHQSLPGHRKTMRLRRALKISQAQAVGHLCMLWLWCLDNCPDGDLSGLDECEIAEAAGYLGRPPGAFLEALAASGFVDRDRRIHDWDQYAGKLIEKREANAQRMRDRRARAAQDHDAAAPNPRAAQDREACAAQPAHVRAMCAATPPDRTLPYPTAPNRESDLAVDRGREDAPVDAPAPPGPAVESYLSAALSPLTPGNLDELRAFQGAGMDDGAVRFAVDQAAAQGVRSWAYVRGILRRWEAEGIRTEGEARAAEEARRAAKARAAPPGRASSPPASKAQRYLDLAKELEQHDAGRNPEDHGDHRGGLPRLPD